MKNTITSYTTKDLDDPQIKKDAFMSKEKSKVTEDISKLSQSKIPSTNRDTKYKTTNQFYSTSFKEINNKIKKLQLTLWNDSATSWTRHKTPKHQIPKAIRFTSLDEDRRKNGQFLRLNLRKQLNKKTSFTKSVRKDHWFDKNKTGYPSAATYQIHRFLENSANISEKSIQKNNESQDFKIYNEFMHTQDNIIDSDHYKNHANTIPLSQFRFDELKGRTFSKAKNYPKVYLDHGKNLPYQEQLFMENAAVGQYQLRQTPGKEKSHYSMRKILTRFNQKLGNTPGPSDYITNKKQQRQRRSTIKSTFTNSNRLDLSKPLNTTPGPSGYNIRRYLQRNK